MKKIMLIFAIINSKVENVSEAFYFKNFRPYSPPKKREEIEFKLVSLEEEKMALENMTNEIILQSKEFNHLVLLNPPLDFAEIKLIKDLFSNDYIYEAILFIPSKELTKDDYSNRSGQSELECNEELGELINMTWLRNSKTKVTKVYKRKWEFSEDVNSFLANYLQ